MSAISFPFSLQRLNRVPIDINDVFATMAELNTYLTSGPAYVGQLVVVTEIPETPLVFTIGHDGDDFIYLPVGDGDGYADIAAHNASATAHPGIRDLIEALGDRVDGLESLGSWAGTFDTFADVPDNISDFEHIAINDFVYVREDENHDDMYSRHFVQAIDGTTGAITWGFDRSWGAAVDATMDMVAAGDTLTVTNAVGGFRLGDTIAATDSAWDITRRLLNPVVPPEYDIPTLTLSGSTPLAREIGENIAPTLTPTFTQNDGGAISEYRLYRGGSAIYTSAIATATTDTEFPLIANVTYNSQVDYAEGPIKQDSEGEDYPEGRIPAGTVTSSNVTYVPQRRGFYGVLTDDTIPNTDAFIRALPNSVMNPANNSQMIVDVPAGARGCIFAYPGLLRAPTSIIQQSLGMNLINAFEQLTVQVPGANGYAPMDYRVYYLLPEFPFASTERYTLII